jgi:DNA polymerase-3 subunit delta
MAPSAARTAAPVVLVFGEDDLAVKRRARQLYQEWCAQLGGMDHEVVEAAAANSGEALRAVGRLREALQTLPFFGDGKAVWFQNCSFLGDDRTAATGAVNDTLVELAQELKAFDWAKVRLLISAGKVDKRKTFYKTLEKIGAVETFAGLSAEDRDWADKAELIVTGLLRAAQKTISDEALAKFVANVGPNARQLHNEAEKLCLYAGARRDISPADVDAIVTRNKQARAFALGDALGSRNLPSLLRALDEEMWEMKFDREKSEIGLLYGLISKVRALILLKEMLREGWLKPTNDFNHFRAQLQRVPADRLPQDKRYNPLSINPYVLFKALPQVQNFTTGELVRAMELLLRANQRLVSSGTDESLVLQQALVQIVGAGTAQTVGSRGEAAVR